jgi:large subunit ribosomal protein L21
MYAIVETGGKQYRVKPGDTIAVERLAGEPGDVLDLGRVLLVAGNGDGKTRIGSPGVERAVVRAEVVEHGRGEKIIVFRYKSKVRYRRKTGHRQALTRLRITDILLDGASTVGAAEPVAARVEPEPAPAEPEGAPETVATTRQVHRHLAAEPAEPAKADPQAELPTTTREDEPEADQPTA